MFVYLLVTPTNPAKMAKKYWDAVPGVDLCMPTQPRITCGCKLAHLANTTE